MKKLIQWIVKKAYQKELETIHEVITSQRIQIQNLKERINYLSTTNIFNFEERKYHK